MPHWMPPDCDATHITGIKINTPITLGGVHHDTSNRVSHTGIKNNTRTT